MKSDRKMMRFLRLRLIFFFGALQCSQLGLAQAAQHEELSRYFEKRVTQMEASLRTSGDSRTVDLSKSIQLTDINVDFIGGASFGLTDVLKLSVMTEIDFVLAPDEPGRN